MIFLSPSTVSGGSRGSTSQERNNQKINDDNQSIEEGSHTLAENSIDSLHPDYKDDETLGTKEHVGADEEEK